MLRFVINLDRSTKRWEAIDSQLQSLGLSAERISAVDKLKLHESFLQQAVPPLDSPLKYYFPRAISAGEIACYLSHRKCWEQLANSTERWALILEDDAILSQRAKSYFDSCDWIPPSVNIIQMSTYERSWECWVLKDGLELPSGDRLLRPISQTYGSVAYLISKKAATRALFMSSKLCAPVDEFLFNFKSPFSREFPLWRLNPACVLHTPDTVSDIRDTKNQIKPFSWKNCVHPRRLGLSILKKIELLFLSRKCSFLFQ